MDTDADESGVAEYLRAHPDFFERHGELLATLRIPNAQGGAAIPLADRQVQALREKQRQLENKLAELILFGEENDVIGEKVHHLAVDLLTAADSDAVLRILHAHLEGAFAVPHVAVRLWDGGAGATAAEASPVPAALRETVGALAQPHCGAAAGQETLAWFGEASGHIRSLALITLRRDRDAAAIGALVLASEEPQRFYAEMGTLYLARIGELAAAALLGVAAA